MRRALKEIIGFASKQINKTKQRPSRILTIPYYFLVRPVGVQLHYYLVRPTCVEFPRFATLSAIRASRYLFPTERRFQRIFAMVTGVLATAPYPSGFQISTRWREKLQSAIAEIDPDDLTVRRVARIGLALFDLELLPLDENERAQLSVNRRSFNARNPELARLCETELLPPEIVIPVDDGSHSTKMNQAFSYYEDIYSGISKHEELLVIAEIGSGYGRLARIMRLLNPARTYILIDIAESLVFSYAFLNVTFPKASVLFVMSDHDANLAATKHYDFVFCPIQFMHSLRYTQIDLVVNTYSFAEMPQPSVNYMMSRIQSNLQPRYIYSLNMMFSDKDAHYDTGGHHGEANELVLNLEPKWSIEKFSLHADSALGTLRLTAAAVLKFDPSDKEKIIARYLEYGEDRTRSSAERLAHLFFAALWNGQRSTYERFFEALKSYHGSLRNSQFDADRIGEIRYLKRLHGYSD